jgi:hypothetical protein
MVMVFEQEFFDAVLVAFDFQHLGIPMEIDFLIAEELFLEDFGGAQFTASVNNGDFRGEFSQVQRILDGGVASPDNGYFLVSVKRSVAGGAVGNASAAEFVLAGNTELSRFGTGAEDNAIGGVNVTIFEADRFDVSGQINGSDGGELFFQTKATGMSGHLFHQFKSRYAFYNPWIIVDPIGYQHLAAGGSFFDKKSFKATAGGIQTGRQARRPTADNYQLILRLLHDCYRQKEGITLCRAPNTVRWLF